jgi:hypothetical protein
MPDEQGAIIPAAQHSLSLASEQQDYYLSSLFFDLGSGRGIDRVSAGRKVAGVLE